jgi:predicted membrane protein
VHGNPEEIPRTGSGQRRRWLLALDPIIEGGRHGKRAQAWDVEDELIAVALLGDVTIDLSRVKSAPAEIVIDAYAIFRDVDVLVAEGTHVEMSGGVLRGDLRNDVPVVPGEQRNNAIRIHGHALLGDVTARIATEHPHVR